MNHAHRSLVLALTITAFLGLAPGPAAAQNEGNVSLTTGVDITNAYYFRGIIQETEGLIAQPWLDASIALADGRATITGGTWNSLHSAPENRDPEMWYESDFYAGIGFAATDEVGIDITYTAYTSPNQQFSTVKEIALGLSYDDGLVGPYATVAFEIAGNAAGDNEGTYLELGIEPGLPLDDAPIGVSFPIAVGLSASDYYDPGGQDGTFGFFSAAAAIGIPISGIPEEYGSWELAGSAGILVFGDALQTINGTGDSSQFIGAIGVSLSY